MTTTAAVEAATFTVTRKGEAMTFTSHLSDDQARACLATVRGDFAASLLARRVWSGTQRAWAHKLASDAQHAQQPQAPANASEAAALFAAFDAARGSGLKRLTLRLDGVNLKPSRDGQALWVTDPSRTEEGRFGPQPAFLGTIRRGQGIPQRLPESAREVLLSAAGDPLAAAVRFGRVTGSCSCCGRTLTDPDSIARGIGPICAERWGW